MRTPLSASLGLEFPDVRVQSLPRRRRGGQPRRRHGRPRRPRTSPPRSSRSSSRWIDEHIDGKPYGVDVVMPAKVRSARSAATPTSSTSTLEGMIPEEHRDFVDELLDELRRRRRCPTTASAATSSWAGPTPPRGRRSRSRCSTRSRCSPTRSARRRRTSSNRRTQQGVGRRRWPAAPSTRSKQVRGRRRHHRRPGHRGRRPHRRDLPRWCSSPRWSTRSADTPVLAAGGIGTRPPDGGGARARRARARGPARSG